MITFGKPWKRPPPNTVADIRGSIAEICLFADDDFAGAICHGGETRTLASEFSLLREGTSIVYGDDPEPFAHALNEIFLEAEEMFRKGQWQDACDRMMDADNLIGSRKRVRRTRGSASSGDA